MKIAIIIFIVTFTIVYNCQALLDCPVVQTYLKKEIRSAKILCLKAKYNIRPEGLGL